jgi:hypothetical protein
MTAGFTRFVVWLVISTTIVVVGWEKPLSYRFMTAQQVLAAEHPNDPASTTRVGPTPWTPRATLLEAPPVKPPQHH